MRKVTGLCAIVLNDEGEILLAKRVRKPFKNKWGLLSGIGASLMGLRGRDAIDKEVQMDLGVGSYGGKLLFTLRIDDDAKINKLEVYSGKIKGKIRPSQKAANEIKWLSLDVAMKKDLAFNHKEILIRYKESLEEKYE